MKQIIFETCMGEIIVNPKSEKLKQLILGGDKEDWAVGSGQSCLKYQEQGIITQMYIMFSEERLEFYAEYFNNLNYYVHVGSEDYRYTTEVYVGGDPIIVPVTFCLTREEMVEELEAFIMFGKVENRKKWTKIEECGWEY